jgi:hypothetical protein
MLVVVLSVASPSCWCRLAWERTADALLTHHSVSDLLFERVELQRRFATLNMHPSTEVQDALLTASVQCCRVVAHVIAGNEDHNIRKVSCSYFQSKSKHFFRDNVFVEVRKRQSIIRLIFSTSKIF